MLADAMTALATNIAENVIFFVEGAQVRHAQVQPAVQPGGVIERPSMPQVLSWVGTAVPIVSSATTPSRGAGPGS
ncbi:MAG: hypothetical protein ACYTGE_14310, partial [Planctomycetota bacterium]